MRESQSLLTLLNRVTDFTGKRSKISETRSSFPTTVSAADLCKVEAEAAEAEAEAAEEEGDDLLLLCAIL